MRFGNNAKVPAQCKLKYYRISESAVHNMGLEHIRLKALYFWMWPTAALAVQHVHLRLEYKEA